jgi:hypothetical protein
MLEELLRNLSLNLTGLTARLRQVFDNPLIHGREITDTFLAGTSTHRIRHGLGRPARGAIIAHQGAAVFLMAAAGEEFVDLTAGGALINDVVVKVWVY